MSGNVARMRLLSPRLRPQLLFSAWHWGLLASAPRAEGHRLPLPEPASPPLAQLTAVGYRLFWSLQPCAGGRNPPFPSDKAESLSQASYSTTALTQYYTTRLSHHIIPQRGKYPGTKKMQGPCNTGLAWRHGGNAHERRRGAKMKLQVHKEWLRALDRGDTPIPKTNGLWGQKMLCPQCSPGTGCGK